MKAISICQPYAHLIVMGRKRVENRQWPTTHRGQLLIHAAKTAHWMPQNLLGIFPELAGEQMAFGALVGIADLIECVRLAELITPSDRLRRDLYLCGITPESYWVMNHRKHVVGPWCWLLGAVERFAEPIPYLGRQSFFRVPDAIFADAVRLPVDTAA